MRPGRVALGLVVALCAATGASSVLPARAAAAAHAGDGDGAQAASAKICVALVVDARSIGSDVSTSCAKVAKGSTGVQVLQAAGHSLAFRSDGLLCTIDGLPKSGCSAVDDTHFWAYWHRAPGSTTWTYSSEGAATYEPVNASTEGWVYDNGTKISPQNVPYAKICTASAKPSPKATPTPTPSRKASHSPQPHVSGPPGPSTSPKPRTSASTSPHPTRNGHRPGSGHSTPPASIRPTPDASASLGATPTTSPSSVILAGGSASSGSGGHGVLDLVLVLAVVTVLGAGAVVATRRRRPSA